MNLFLIFITGLTTGGIACAAMQGGLLASVIANQKDQEHEAIVNDKKQLKEKKKAAYVKALQKRSARFSLDSFDELDWMPVGMFLLSKFVAHVILGFMLGLLGSAITLSLEVRLFFQIFTAFFMFATAMNLLDVHPIFRYVAFQPPKFLQRYIRNSSKSKALFAPALLGLLTVFIPCGVTQAMEVLAINSGNPISGALILGTFVLGTVPLFAVIGVATAKLSEGWYQKFTKIASVVLIGMALYSVNGVLIVTDAPITLSKIVRPVTYFFSSDRFAESNGAGSGMAQVVNGVQKVTINAVNQGYSPNYVTVKQGVPVELTVQSNGTYSCALSFIFKEFNISANLKATDAQTFTFTPTSKGKFTFTCSMGMYTGVMEVK